MICCDDRKWYFLALSLVLLSLAGTSCAKPPAGSATTNQEASHVGRAPQLRRFAQYPVTRNALATMVPSGYEQDSNGLWRDDMGKRVDEPKMNFSGKYYLGLHSCGAGCRYYTLTDLTSGAESLAIDMFNATELPPTTRDGFPYVTNLLGRPDSKMLVAQYLIQAASGEVCRERVFVLDGAKFVPITTTVDGCRS